MGLFDKKYCDICGEKIGLLGNRKLAGGNCCKACAGRLSPWMTDRRESTVEEIKQHLAYRAENERALEDIHPTKVIGERTKVYIDEEKGVFFVEWASDWRAANPDLVRIDQVVGCDVDIREHKSEIYRENSEGKRESYNPRRFEYEYEFYVTIHVDSPWFTEMSFELTANRPDSPYTDAYREYEREADALKRALDPDTRKNIAGIKGAVDALLQGFAQGGAGGAAQAVAGGAAQVAADGWQCACGTVNKGKFCTECGAKKPPEAPLYRCDKCGWQPEDPAHPPKFCPECGDPFNDDDSK